MKLTLVNALFWYTCGVHSCFDLDDGEIFGVGIESCNALYVELIVFVLIYSVPNVVKKFDHGHALFGAGQVGHRVAELTSTSKI